MTETLSKEILFPTPKGDIRILSYCSPDQIQQYTFDYPLENTAHYKPLYTRRESLVEKARRGGSNVVLALAEPKHIIGFGVLAYPDADERWAELGPKIMMELKAIEVCRSWRSSGIASRIIRMMLADPNKEELIIYLVGYSWTWDLKGAKMTGQEYRHMLIRIFEPLGFREYETNEPNVCLRPENILMCRIGNHISQMIRDRFKWLRFGLSPWNWMV